MSEKIWAAVEDYYGGLLVREDEVLAAALAASREAGLPAINVSAAQGKFLQMLVQIQGARRVLEIGTLAGYSTIWMARGMAAGGKLVTLEFDERHAEVARGNILRAGLSDVVDVRVGMAIETLPRLEKEGVGPFDVVFIDADKVSTADYFLWAVKLSHRGSLIIVDNVVREGAIVDGASTDESVRGVRRFNEMAAKDSRVSATVLQTVGGKGYDGFAMLLVVGGLRGGENIILRWVCARR